MKKFITLFLVFLLSLTAFSQGKLVKSSTKSQPKWLKREVDQYKLIKVSATSTIDLETAKKIAYDKLRSDIIIATTRYMLSISINGDENNIRKEVENSQFVRNISESASIETYWEERYERRKKIASYNYYILYYFNDFEMRKISLEINQGKSSTLDAVNKL